MNANLPLQDFSYATAESILLRTLEDSLPDLWIVEELDIRDAVPDEDFMLEWHYPGKCNVQGLVPDVDLTEVTRPLQDLSTQVPRRQLVARGILSGGRTIKSDY
ncbi:MAG: hypothetical protein U0103_18525 [Candidatus Obscuribacterales bacterium]